MATGMFQAPRPLTPEEFFRLQGEQDFVNFISQTNNQLGMLQEAQRMSGDGDLLDEDIDSAPTGELDPSLAEESVWNMLTSIMAGTQGTIEGLDPEIINALKTSLDGVNAEELRSVAAEIVAAGGYQEWLAQQPTGDPGDTQPQPEPEPEPEPEPPQQVGISLEDFQTQFENVEITQDIVDSGMYTDPETGTVYVINFPPDYQIPEDAGGGGGELEPQPTDGIQIEEDDEWVYEGNGIFRRNADGAVIDVTDPNSGFYDDDFDPENNPFIVGDVYGGPGRVGEPEPTPEPEPVTRTCPPGTVYNDLLDICEIDLTVPTKGDAPRQAPIEPTDPVDPNGGNGNGGEGNNGDGNGNNGNGGGDDGDGSGDGERNGMFEDKFKPFMTSIGYTPVQLQQLVTPPKKDYMRELDGLFGRLLG
jgi:hypothetical protein